MAERLLDEAAKGEPWAIKELADRLDGRSVQANSFEADGGTVTELVVRWLDPVLTLKSDSLILSQLQQGSIQSEF